MCWNRMSYTWKHFSPKRTLNHFKKFTLHIFIFKSHFPTFKQCVIMVIYSPTLGWDVWRSLLMCFCLYFCIDPSCFVFMVNYIVSHRELRVRWYLHWINFEITELRLSPKNIESLCIGSSLIQELLESVL